MKSLSDQFLSLDQAARCRVHFSLCENALSKWQEFADSQSRIRYSESVVGTRQEVDKQLPADALNSARQRKDTANVEERYMEPIAAMQDNDLEFQEQITFAYYAIYNLFRRYVVDDEIDDWLIVNQAMSAEQDLGKMAAILAAAIREAI